MAMFDAHGVPLSIGDPVAVFRSNTLSTGYVRKETPKSIGIYQHRYNQYNSGVDKYAAPSEKLIALSSHPDRRPVHGIGEGRFLAEIHHGVIALGWEVVRASDYSIDLIEAELSLVTQMDLDNNPDMTMVKVGYTKLAEPDWPSGKVYTVMVDPGETIKAPSGAPLVLAVKGPFHWVSRKV